jgi:hypothetical protein
VADLCVSWKVSKNWDCEYQEWTVYYYANHIILVLLVTVIISTSCIIRVRLLAENAEFMNCLCYILGATVASMYIKSDTTYRQLIIYLSLNAWAKCIYYLRMRIIMVLNEIKVKVVPLLNSLSTAPWKHPALSRALDGDEWSASRSSHFAAREIPPGYPLGRLAVT